MTISQSIKHLTYLLKPSGKETIVGMKETASFTQACQWLQGHGRGRHPEARHPRLWWYRSHLTQYVFSNHIDQPHGSPQEMKDYYFESLYSQNIRRYFDLQINWSHYVGKQYKQKSGL